MHPLSKTALYNAIGTIAYIFLVASILNSAGRLFGNDNNGIFSGVAFLCLFTLSALVVGSLVLGKPLTLYLDGKKKEAISLFTQTVGWLAGITAVLMVAIAMAHAGK